MTPPTSTPIEQQWARLTDYMSGPQRIAITTNAITIAGYIKAVTWNGVGEVDQLTVTFDNELTMRVTPDSIIRPAA